MKSPLTNPVHSSSCPSLSPLPTATALISSSRVSQYFFTYIIITTHLSPPPATHTINLFPTVLRRESATSDSLLTDTSGWCAQVTGLTGNIFMLYIVTQYTHTRAHTHARTHTWAHNGFLATQVLSTHTRAHTHAHMGTQRLPRRTGSEHTRARAHTRTHTWAHTLPCRKMASSHGC